VTGPAETTANEPARLAHGPAWANRYTLAPMTNKQSQTLRLKGRSFAETRSAVLDLIRCEGKISRTDLARRSALTEKTISVVAKSLMESGVVIESGFAKSTGGKRPVLLRLNDKQLYAVGVSLYLARCIIVVCGLDGNQVARSAIRGRGTDDPTAVLKRISTTLTRLLQRNDIGKDSIVGICMAMGGRLVVPEGWQTDSLVADIWGAVPGRCRVGQTHRLDGDAGVRR
jgi:DNA-binding MarR family transcriptional regulator